jgi:hypothetical protein
VSEAFGMADPVPVRPSSTYKHQRDYRTGEKDFHSVPSPLP